MKHFSKALALVMVILIMSTTLIGCSSDELSVFNAMVKAQSIKSMEAKTDISLKLDISGYPEEDKDKAQMLVNMLNNTKLTLNQKVNQDLEKGISKAQIDGNINAGGMAMDFGLWVDADYLAEKPVIKEIFKLPRVALMALPSEIGSKDYIVIDAGQMMNDVPGTAPNTNQIMSMSKQIQEKAINFLNSYTKQFNPGFNIVKATGTKVINGVSLSTYQLKLDDSTIKALAKYIVGDFVKNKETQTLVKDLMLSITKSMEALDPQSKDASINIEKSFTDMEANLPVMESQFNAFMDTFKDVKLFGDNGITINYAVNNQGYIVNESGVIDLVIDTKAIQNAAQKLESIESEEVPPVVIKLSIAFNTDISKINENVEVKFPELTKENSADFFEIMNSIKPIPEPIVFPEDNDPGVKVYVNDKKVKFNDSPLISNGRTLAPAREVFESLGGEILWNPDTQTVTSVVGDNIIVFTVDSSKAIINGLPYELEVPATLVNDRAYVPVRFLAESLGGHVYWNDETSTAIIIN